MSAAAGDVVRAALAGAVRRLRLRSLLEQVGWALLAAVLAGELALALWPHAPAGAGLLALAGALGAAFALRRAWRARPGTGLAAAVLDARLGGAALSTAAEALGGAHPRFGGLVLAEAAARLEGHSLAALLPLRAPAGLLMGGAAAALLPALLLAPAARGAALPPVPAPPSLLSPQALAGGGAPGGAAPAGEAPGEEPAQPAPGDAQLAVPVPAGAGPELDALAGYPPEVADLLRARLEELARELPPGGGGASGAPGEPAESGEPAGPAGPGALERALAGRDPEALLAALEAEAAAAARGDQAAAARLRELADRLGPPGAGAGEGSATGAPAAPEPEGGAVLPPGPEGAGGRARALPPELRTALRRYFAAGD